MIPPPSRLLLDTHVVLWLLDDNPRLGPQSRSAIAGSPAAHVSAVSTWELELKASLGKVELPEDFDQELSASGLRELPVSVAHTRAVRDVVLPHKDPFDALLVAQARVEGLVLVTADRALLGADLDGVADAHE